MLAALLSAALLPLQQVPVFTPEPGYARPRNRVASDKAIRIYFLRTSFANDTDPSTSRHSEESIQTIGRQLSDFFKIQSYGALTVGKFEVSPVIKVGESAGYERYDEKGTERPAKERKPIIVEAIRAAEASTGRKLRSEFDFICILVNGSPTKGRIAPQGVAALATGPQNSIFFTANPQWRVFAHEIGHNFGFPHAWSVSAKTGDITLPPMGERTFIEYGDALSPMGKGSNSYSLIERYRMGWIGSATTDARYIQKLATGNVKFGAYDRPDAKGLVGGYLEGDFGVELKELVSRRDTGDNGGEAESVAEPGPQRLWLSVISRTNMTAQGEMPDSPQPVLLAHLSGLVPSTKGPARASTTVSLDLKPASKNRREGVAQRGLIPGQTGEVRMKDGKRLTITFVRYNADKHVAEVETKIE